MRFFLICLLIVTATSCQSKSEPVEKEAGLPQELEGAWRVVEIEMNERKSVDRDFGELLFIFTDGKLAIVAEEEDGRAEIVTGKTKTTRTDLTWYLRDQRPSLATLHFEAGSNGTAIEIQNSKK